MDLEGKRTDTGKWDFSLIIRTIQELFFVNGKKITTKTRPGSAKWSNTLKPILRHGTTGDKDLSMQFISISSSGKWNEFNLKFKF